MPAYKVLGQSAPTANTATTLYTVPSATSTVVSTIFVCNRGTSVGSYRIAVRPSGASLSNEHYIAYDVSVNPKATDAFTNGITLATTDVVTIYASTGDFSFSAFGSELP